MNTKTNNPLVSVALATYNGEKYLKQQLDSIYNQSYKNIEIIVNDDCSTDKTIVILDEYSKLYNLKYNVNIKNIGFVKNFEKALQSCKGDFIALSDQDDIWVETKIEKLLNNIANNILIHSDASLINEFGVIISQQWKNEINSHRCFNDFLFSNVVTGCTVLFKKELLDSVLPFPEDLAYHDWLLGLYAAKNDKIIYINEPLVLYRQHALQDTGVEKKGLFYALFLEKVYRLLRKETRRMTGYKKQLDNLKSIENSKTFNNYEQMKIKEAILYFNDYIKHFIHLKMFYIGCKNRKNIYFKNNYLCIKNILLGIIG